jgi:hypothetical protein
MHPAVQKMSWKICKIKKTSLLGGSRKYGAERTKHHSHCTCSHLRKKEDTKRIFEIKEILGMKVTIEVLRKSNLILQCKNCQAYGHTQKHCGKEVRCVKCIGKHHMKECKKPNQSHPKCVNCGEAHPANYRGCVVAKELQKIQNSAIRRKTENTLC